MWHKPIFVTLFWAGRLIVAVWRRIGLRVATSLQRATLAKVGTGTQFQRGVRFAQPKNVTIGADCYVWTGCHASAEQGDAPLTIGDGVQINRSVYLDTTGGLAIGAKCLISEEAVIYTHDHGLDPRATAQPFAKTIGPDVWIGMRAVILPQCQQIGAGAVIGAGAIVTMDVPAGAVVAGNPARIIGQRDRLAGIAA